VGNKESKGFKMKTKHYLLILFLINCSILFGQNWVRHSDSIISNIRNNNLSKAKIFLKLAEKDLSKSTFIRDTVYADFLYRKGLLRSFQNENPEKEFNESITIWNGSNNVNLKKVMRLYFFLGNYYYNTSKNYDKAYKYYSLCYDVGKQIDFDSINDFKKVAYRLHVIDKLKNNNNKEATDWANIYLNLKKDLADEDFDFDYVRAFGFVNGEAEGVKLLERYLKLYNETKIENQLVLQGIHFEMMRFYYTLDNYPETINSGEQALKIINISDLKLDRNKDLTYKLLISAYQEIGDNINQEKYVQLKEKYFPNIDEIDYYEELNRLMKTGNFSAFESQFDIYEERLKTEKKYGDLLLIYTLSITLFERGIIYDKTTIDGQINFLTSHKNQLNDEKNTIFDLMLAEFSFFTQDFLKALKICNLNLDRHDDNFKLMFLKIKSIAERLLGMPNAQENAYKVVELARKLYGNDNPKILPYLILPLSANVTGNDNRSIAIATKALQLVYRYDLEQTEIAAQLWGLLGQEANLKNNFSDAENYYNKAYKIYSRQEQVTNPILYYTCLLGLANASLLQADYINCWSYLEKARVFIDNQNNLMPIAQGDYYYFLGNYYFYQDDFLNAKLAYKKSFSIYSPELSRSRQMNYILSEYFIENNVDKTIKQLEDFYKTNGNITKVLKIIYLLKFNTGHDDEAKALLLNSIHQTIAKNDAYFHLLSDTEREILYIDFTDEFEFLNTHLLSTFNQKFLNEYLNLRFYFKSLLLYNTKQASAQNDLEIANYRQLKENRALLNKYFEQSENFSNEIKELKYENRELEKFISSSNSKIESPSLESVAKQLKDKEAYVEIIRINKQSRSATKDKLNILNKFTDSIYYGAFIVKKSGSPTFVLIDSTNALEKDFLKEYKDYSVGSKKNEVDTSSYNLFFKPIEKKLDGIETVYLVTDGAYNSINTESFYNTKKNKYVIEYLDIKPILSARSLIKRNESNAHVESSTAVLVGNPDYELKNFSPPNTDEVVLDESISLLLRSYDPLKSISYLPGTEQEIQNISTILKAFNWDTELYHLNTATEDNLKAVTSPKILHIATHGYFINDVSLSSNDNRFYGIGSNYVQDNSLLKSGLLLAGAQNTIDGNTIPLNNNGILTAQEAKNLDLKGTELVVLSACETGKGDNVIGEGVYGLQRSFMLAGARSIIMSFWNVNDETTQKLMTYFYTNWIEKDLPKYDAFRLAKLKLKDEFPEPFYWASFVLLE